MSNQYIGYSLASGYGYGGYDYRNGMSNLERERADWEREKELRHQQWLKYEEDCEKWIKKRYALLKKREQEMTLCEQEMANQEKEVGKREKALEEENVKVLEQYKRAKKLERQGKRREERIEKAQQRLQFQANEFFSTIYTTFQLSLSQATQPAQSFRSSTLISSVSASMSSSSPQPSTNIDNTSSSSRLSTNSSSSESSESHSGLRLILLLNSLSSNSWVPRPRSTISNFNNGPPHSKSLLKFGRRLSPISSLPSVLPLSVNEYSPCGCTTPDENVDIPTKFDVNSDSQIVEDNEASDDGLLCSESSPFEVGPAPSSVETVDLVSTKRSTFDTVFNKTECHKTTVIDVGAPVISASEKLEKADMETYTRCLSLKHVTTFQCDKHNPHVDWGPLFQSQSIFVVSA